MIPTTVINEARILAVEAFYSVPRGGVEIGGVWFGKREGNTLHVCAQRPIRCQYSTGPSFNLSINDQLGQSGLLEGAHADPELQGLSPLGWYHSHTRSEIFLSPADLSLYNEFFPEKWQIAVVLRPANLQPTRAGFFFRDRSGAIKSDAPLEEFRLEPPTFGLTLLDSPGAAAGAEVAPAPVPVPVKRPAPVVTPPPPAPAPAVPSPVALTPVAPTPVVAAQPVTPTPAPVPASIPIARVPTPPAASAPPPPPPPAQRIPEAPQRTPEPSPAKPPMDLMQALAPDPPERVSVAATVASVKPVDPPPAAPPPPPQRAMIPEPVDIPRFLAPAKPKPRRSRGWMWGLAGLVLLCGAGGAAVMKWGPLLKPTTDLGLETYDINGSFLIRWDRDCKLFRSAKKVTLEIQDGGEKTPIELTTPELNRGGYGYMRRTGQVSVHMVVEGPSPAEEYSNFNSAESLGSQPGAPPGDTALSHALTEKEHLKTELINESMQSLDLRREIDSLKRQLAEERAKNTSAPAQ